MKTPRNLNGKDLCDRMSRVGYFRDRKAGDHFVMVNEARTHTVSVPQHKPLKVGTLASILNDLIEATGLSREELFRKLGL